MTKLEITEVVQEVVEFFTTGPVLAPHIASAGLGSGYIPLKSLGEAQQIAYHREPYWSDLRERQMAPLHGLYHREGRPHVGAEFDEAMLPHETKILRRFRRTIYEELSDDIVGDFRGIALSRALRAKEGKFHERLFDAYLQGGWPCGWEGRYPLGRMYVFMPSP